MTVVQGTRRDVGFVRVSQRVVRGAFSPICPFPQMLLTVAPLAVARGVVAVARRAC
jgi:hypothetical protein